MIDTHAHLDAGPDPPEALIDRARRAGVDRIVAVGSGIDSSRDALRLAGENEGVFAALGIHPHQAGSDEGARLPKLRELLASDRAVAVGETGLDFFRDYAPRSAQRSLFERHLEIAAEVGKPVVVHSREAESATAEMLGQFAGTVVLHCFSSPDLLEIALDRAYYVSFAGNVTYAKAGDLREAARAVPADRILAETDTPYLSPQPVRGKRNEPAHVVHTLAVLAAARGEEPDELAEQIDANAAAAFRLPA